MAVDLAVAVDLAAASDDRPAEVSPADVASLEELSDLDPAIGLGSANGHRPVAGQGSPNGRAVADGLEALRDVGPATAGDAFAIPILPGSGAGHAVAGPTPGDAGRSGCTSPQLRRFIKSRAYIPMHELRRRFAIEGPEDDVSAIDVDGSRLYVGLPERESRLLAELLRGGDVGAELSHDPVTPVIVGVYPMRPVPRS